MLGVEEGLGYLHEGYSSGARVDTLLFSFIEVCTVLVLVLTMF